MLSHYSQPDRFKYLRQRLVKELQTQGITNKNVLNTILNTPRHLFVDDALFSHAYTNSSLPIGCGQTISQPYIVARMTETLLSHGQPDSVLEVGTGCGYQTAILAQLVRKVYSVERIQDLSKKAGERLHTLGINNVELYYNDGQQGLAKHAPYEGIIVTAAPKTIPNALLSQLSIGGCLVIPFGPNYHQILAKVIRHPSYYEQHQLDNVSFVPLCDGLN